ncbi:MAG: hypothetical protein BJBARM5_1040 [Candidatus Parvarchaeum acidophilus ARMAN-5]|uniref:Uncharacterized protein n=1 Tax=Candidatus Parvarchaeum acidophilus ARMAN-5 TaxID=662762 RepID=D6GX16_PARA5|nr:MAG: hypothetical protein BJBARM5_1040 [Candidatus Parvarchaeum acidophilus ARMAN-5]
MLTVLNSGCIQMKSSKSFYLNILAATCSLNQMLELRETYCKEYKNDEGKRSNYL